MAASFLTPARNVRLSKVSEDKHNLDRYWTNPVTKPMGIGGYLLSAG